MLFDGYRHVVFSTALRLCGRWTDEEDLTVEAFLRAYRALSGYDGERIEQLRPRAWLLTILANLWRNHARSAARRLETGCELATLLGELPAGPESRPELDAEFGQAGVNATAGSLAARPRTKERCTRTPAATVSPGGGVLTSCPGVLACRVDTAFMNGLLCRALPSVAGDGNALLQKVIERVRGEWR